MNVDKISLLSYLKEENILQEQNRISSDGKVHDAQRLKELQALPLDRKIGITQARIMEFYREFDGKVYVSFSGGKDSTVLLDITRKLFPEVEAVFIDTGLEYPKIREFVKTKENVTWLKPEMNFREVINKYGYPFPSKEQAAFIEEYKHSKSEKLKSIRINGNKYNRGKISKKWLKLIDAPFNVSDKCCDVMKKHPAEKFEKEFGLHPIIGTTAQESAQRKSNWIKYGCNAFDTKRATSRPLSFWAEQDILQYIKLNNFKIAEPYGDIVENEDGKLQLTGVPRTGCMFCMFGITQEKEPNKFQRMKITDPAIYNYCIEKLDIKKVLDYAGVKY